MGIETLYSHRHVRDFARYMTSQNNATQAVAAKGAGTNPHFQSTGGAQCIIDGTLVTALTAITTLDMSNAAVALPIEYPLANRADGPQPLAGKVVADDGQFYLLVTSGVDGGDGDSYAYWAHDNLTAEDDAAPTLAVPYYSPAQLTIGLILYDNDGTSGAFTIGTTNVVANDDTYYQLIGPNLLPAPTNWKLS